MIPCRVECAMSNCLLIRQVVRDTSLVILTSLSLLLPALEFLLIFARGLSSRLRPRHPMPNGFVRSTFGERHKNPNGGAGGRNVWDREAAPKSSAHQRKGPCLPPYRVGTVNVLLNVRRSGFPRLSVVLVRLQISAKPSR